MLGSEFKNVDKINSLFLSQNPVSEITAERMYNDPYYGLSNSDNYYHWNGFLATTDPLQRIAWRWEVKTYFDLTFSQVDEMETNWNMFYTNALNEVVKTIPSPDNYLNINGVAYWQWADGYMTQYRSFPYKPSVAEVVNTVTGYPEISYFISNFLLNSAVSGVSAENIKAFTGVQLWKSKTGPSDDEPPTDNYEHLFSLIS